MHSYSSCSFLYGPLHIASTGKDTKCVVFPNAFAGNVKFKSLFIQPCKLFTVYTK